MNEVGGGNKLTFNAKLDITLLNSNEEVKDEEENSEVIEDYYRVKAAEVLEEARKLSDKNKFKEA